MQALMCFRKAKDTKGEKIARAHILEDQGRRCGAVDDVEGFTQNLQAAVDLFLEVKLMGDATRNLERMGKFSEAAGEVNTSFRQTGVWLNKQELCFQQAKYSKAAPLFAEAGLFDRAASCYHLTERYDEAAAALRQGNHFDQLVSYLSQYVYTSTQSLEVHTKAGITQQP
jgi:tetratricopeptide (TPR) repeat protein